MSLAPGPGQPIGLPTARARSTASSRGLILAVRWYRDVISPALPARCRFYPSCSAYAVTALERHGLLRGIWLALRRILRCGPWHPGGVDHVPSVSESAPRRQLHDRGSEAATPAKDVGRQERPVSQETAVV